MESYCSTGQSPQRAVAPMEEGEEVEEEEEKEEEEEYRNGGNQSNTQHAFLHITAVVCKTICCVFD